jgi:signal peptidase II
MSTLRERRTGLLLAVVAVGLALDQATKLWILRGLGFDEYSRIAVTPFLDLVLVWNRGISYGLLEQDGDLGRWLLVGFSVVAAVVMLVWALRSTTRLAVVSLALIIAGALGNMIDRVAYGAVVDFVHLHALGYSWYVFNLADVWIVAGVVGLLYESFRPGHRDAALRD